MHRILFIFLLLFTYLYSGELDDRKDIEQQAIKLFKTGQYDEISKLANKYLKTEERTDGGRWKLRFLYAGIYKSSDGSIKDINYWNDLEKKHLEWIHVQPNEATPYIAYSQFLISKGWMYRGGDYAYKVPKKKWKLFKNEIDKATKYLIDHKDVASKHPHWYTVMLNLAKLNGSNKIVFNTLVNEALNKYPHYYSIYEFILYYMHPKWNHYSKEEIEKVAQNILYQTKDKEGTYARFYWMANDILNGNKRVDFDIDWSLMKKSIDRLIESYPTKYNINGLAYLTCSLNKKELTNYYISKIKGKPNLDIWYSEENFNICKNSINTKLKKITIPIVNPNNLIEYLNKSERNKPTFIYFSSYKKEDIIKDIYKIEKIAKEFKDKVDFISVNMYPHTMYAYPELVKKYYLKNIPSCVIIYKKKIILRIDEMTSFKQYMSEILKRNIDDILKEMKYTNFIKYFKESIIDEGSYVNTEENVRNNIQDYLKAPTHYKAISISSSKKRDIWVFGSSLSKNSQEEANEEAIGKCEKQKKKYSFLNECKLFMINNRYIFERNNTFIVKEKRIEHTKNINLKKYKSNSPVSLKQIKDKYKKSKLYKAWAIMEYTSFSVYHELSDGKATQNEANIDVLKQCEIHRIESNVPNECILYMSGDEYMYSQNITYSKISQTYSNKKFKRLSTNKILGYLNKIDKPIIIYFKDKNSNLVIEKEISMLGQKYVDKINFVIVDTDLNLISKNVKNYFNLKRVPCIALVYKEHIVMINNSNNFSDLQLKFINQQIKSLLQKKDSKDYMNRYTKGIYHNLYSIFNTDILTKINTKRYIGLKGYKAWAISLNDEYSIGSWVFQKENQEKANKDALEKCETTRLKRKLSHKCILYMINNEYVYENNITNK